MISNKTLFEVYLILRFVVFITLLIVWGMIITMSFTKMDFFQIIFFNNRNDCKDALLMFNWFLICLVMIDERIKPGFIEFYCTEDLIIIKIYNPHLNKWESPFVLFGYKQRTRELKISREEYNDYKLITGKFIFRKELRLQKTNNNGVYETLDISISLLRQKEYANLISVLDKLKKEKTNPID